MSKKAKISITLCALVGVLAVAVPNFIAARCATAHNSAIDTLRQPHASRSSDGVNICRQFLAEVGNSMLESKRETFRPGDLSFGQLAVLTPRDPDFVSATFLALNQEWRFKEAGKRIVIVCSQGRITDSGKVQYFAGYDSGEYGWIDQDVFAKLSLADYVALPKIK